MNDELKKCLPDFRMYHAFFEELGDDFDPMTLSEDEKRESVEALWKLTGSPAHEFRQLCDDLNLTAQVREARRYAEDRIYVRFDFRRMTDSGGFGEPLQLMVVFDELWNIQMYTVLRDRGELEEGVRYSMTKVRSNWDRFDTTEEVAEALAFLEAEPMGEIGVTDIANGHRFLYIYAGKGEGGTGYDIEWYLGCEPWHLTVKGVDLACVRHVLDELDRGGVKAIEEAVDWRQFDFVGHYRKDGFRFEIDRELHRFLARAKKEGNTMVEETIRTVGIGEEQNGKPYAIRVHYASERIMLEELFGQTIPKMEADDGDWLKVRTLAYLALRQHVKSIHGLGWFFHFGRGVPVDYPKAIFWQEKSAAMGDDLSMQNLGCIYAERTSPVHDCAKAAAWYERAIATGGNAFAMEQLANCLLCGENGEDVKRALELSKRACEIHPEKKDFRKTYKRALRASRGEKIW